MQELYKRLAEHKSRAEGLHGRSLQLVERARALHELNPDIGHTKDKIEALHNGLTDYFNRALNLMNNHLANKDQEKFEMAERGFNKQMEQYENKINFFENVINKMSDLLIPKHAKRAEELYNNGEFEEAERILKHLETANPKHDAVSRLKQVMKQSEEEHLLSELEGLAKDIPSEDELLLRKFDIELWELNGLELPTDVKQRILYSDKETFEKIKQIAHEEKNPEILLRKIREMIS